jgi:hypothetical protein
MTEAEWTSCKDNPRAMLDYLREMEKRNRTKSGRRKFRLFAVGCCRLIWDHLPDAQLREAVEIAERFADGQAKKQQLTAARHAAAERKTVGSYERHVPGGQARAAVSMASDTTKEQSFHAAFDMALYPEPFAGYPVAGAGGHAGLCDLLRCVFGNPFKTVRLDQRWRTANVLDLARTIYQECAFDRLPILADALMDSGCSSEPILAHCRASEAHVRGCWVVDLILEMR